MITYGLKINYLKQGGKCRVPGGAEVSTWYTVDADGKIHVDINKAAQMDLEVCMKNCTENKDCTAFQFTD